MKPIFATILFLVLFLNSFSQKVENDTLSVKRVVRSNWAIKIESGVLGHKILNQDFIDNKSVQVTGLSVYYRKFFFIYDVFICEFSPKKEIRFNNALFNQTDLFSSFNLNVALGYNCDFSKNWSADAKFGFNTTDFELIDSKYGNQKYESDILMGTLFGLGLNRYFKLKRYNYLVLRLGADYYSTDYTSINPQLGNSSMNYSLTIGYKGWFRKLIN